MAKSEITMPTPYAVVLDAIRTERVDRYRVTFTYDSSCWTTAEVERSFWLLSGWFRVLWMGLGLWLVMLCRGYRPGASGIYRECSAIESG